MPYRHSSDGRARAYEALGRKFDSCWRFQYTNQETNQMLTVKVKRRSNDGLSLDRNTTISAIEVVTDYMHQPDDSVLYTVDVVNYKGTVHSFE